MSEFKYEPEDAKSPKNMDDRKITVTHCGEKGEGKTTSAMGWPGRIVTLSFDKKSFRVWDGVYNDDPRITVLNPVKYIKHRNLDIYTGECEKTIRYVMFLMSEIEKRGGTDWILFDGSDRMTKIIEMNMRYRGHINAFAGVEQRGLWNLRTFDLRKLHNWAIQISRYGVIYTTFRDIIDLEHESEKKQVYKPAWTDVIKEETDILIESSEVRSRDRNHKLQVKFMATVVTSKAPKLLRTGEEFDLTNTTIKDHLRKTGRLRFFDRFPKLKIKKVAKHILD